MRNKNLLDVNDLQIEPITDEVLSDVLGGLGEEDGLFQSCSKERCSNDTKEEVAEE